MASMRIVEGKGRKLHIEYNGKGMCGIKTKHLTTWSMSGGEWWECGACGRGMDALESAFMATTSKN